MATNKKAFTLRLEPENYEKFQSIAKKNRRSMAGELELIVEQYIATYESNNGQILLSDKNEKPGATLKVSGNNYFSNNNNSFNTTAV